MKDIAEMRRFVAETMTKVVAGTVKPEVAARVEKLAARITESFHVEAKFMRLALDQKKAPHVIGSLPIESSEGT